MFSDVSANTVLAICRVKDFSGILAQLHFQFTAVRQNSCHTPPKKPPALKITAMVTETLEKLQQPTRRIPEGQVIHYTL
jgi:hypothetical protein